MWAYLMLVLFLSSALAGAEVPPAQSLTLQPSAGAVSSAHPLATRAGREVLLAGGNAFDAAVAVTAALAVVEPFGSGLGGGGFWLLHRARDGHEVMVDGRERAPLAAHRDLYLDARGELVPGLSVDGPLAAAIPGTPAAIAHLAREYGRLPLRRALAPAIELAREGFEVGEQYRRMAGFRLEVLRASPAAAAVFLHEGEVPPAGHRVRQPDLADTLERIAEQGAAGFYEGPLARALVAGTRAAGGIWTLEDLAEYRVVERAPITGRYGDVRITAAAPPSSGGVALLTILNILAQDDLEALSEAQRVHRVVEAMRRAYRDRAQYLGDPDFVQVPVERLTHPHYAAGLHSGIHPERATPSASLPGVGEDPRGRDTTHFSILDAEGNRVGATLSINYPFGSGFMPADTGVLLNDEMDDFAAAPGVPNVYGLVGAQANAIEPGKRPLSSMTPTFLDDGERVAILGTPGGSRIITMVLLGVLDFAHGDGGPEQWVARPRFHHQYLPDTVQHEPKALDEALRANLTARGHVLEQVEPYGNMQAVMWDRLRGTVAGASDPRGEGATEIVQLRAVAGRR